MSELIDAVVNWPTLLIVLGVFGFAPRAVLRLLLLAYPKDCPRRAELMAELKAVPRLDRPLWVAEQIELALSEGLPLRRQARRADTSRGRPRGDASGPEGVIVAAATMAELHRCVAMLGLDQQECLILRFWRGMSVAETAAHMGRNEGAIKVLQHRAIRRLAQLMPEDLR